LDAVGLGEQDWSPEVRRYGRAARIFGQW